MEMDSLNLSQLVQCLDLYFIPFDEYLATYNQSYFQTLRD